MTDETTPEVLSMATLLTPEQVAKQLGHSAAWVTKQCRDGRMTHLRIGRTYRFTQADVDDYLQTTIRYREAQERRKRQDRSGHPVTGRVQVARRRTRKAA